MSNFDDDPWHDNKSFSSPEPAKQRPTHFLNAYIKGTQLKRRVGAAWLKPDGSISIALDPFTVLEANDGDGLGLTLWPRNERDDARGR